MDGKYVLLFALSTLVLIVGLFIYNSQSNEKLLWKAYNRSISKLELKLIGKATIAVGIIIFTITLVELMFEY